MSFFTRFICFENILIITLLSFSFVTQCYCQVGGMYDLGEGRRGERRGHLGPAGIAGITIGAVAIAGALAVTVFFCYYVHQKQKQAAQAYGNPPGGFRKPYA